jgi:hypothetical protein
MSISTVKLGGVIAEFVAAVNAFDEDGIVATFADDALVNDARREFWGTDAIRRWVREEIVGDRVTGPMCRSFRGGGSPPSSTGGAGPKTAATASARAGARGLRAAWPT